MCVCVCVGISLLYMCHVLLVYIGVSVLCPVSVLAS